MVDPWAAAAAVLFQMPGSTGAIYTPLAGDAVSCRAIVTTQPVDIIVGSRTIDAGSTMVQLQRSDFGPAVPAPAVGGVIVADGVTYEIMGQPRLDLERTEWMCEVREV